MPRPRPSSRSPWLGRGGLIVFGLVLGLVLAEGGLQLLRAAKLIQTETQRRDLAGRRVAYAIGDSHTWGWNVHSLTEAPPVRLEARLNHEHPDGPFVVENLGFPGFNAAQSLDRLRVACAEHRPDVVLVLAGFNDAWNPQEARAEESWLVLPRLLKLMRLEQEEARGDPTQVHLVDGVPHHRDEQGRLIPVRGEGASEDLRSGAAHRQSVERGLRAIVDFCREQDLPVVLQTYASTQNARFLDASQAARAVAEDEDVPLADHAAWFAEHQLDPQLHLQPDGHPTARGCDEMAEALALALRANPATAPWTHWSPPEGVPELPVVHLQLADPVPCPEGWSLQLQGDEPGATWQLLLSRSLRPSDQPATHHPDLLLAIDPLLLESRQFTYDVQGRLDAQGRATATVHRAFVEQHGPPPYHAQAVLLRKYPTGDPREDVRATSATVILTTPE